MWQLVFQSAPLTEARGDGNPCTLVVTLSQFQSAPLTEARGDPETPPPAGSCIRFNPLPLPKQGETLHICPYTN